MDYKEIVDFWEKGREKFFDYQFEVGKIGNLIYGFLEYKLNIKDLHKAFKKGRWSAQKRTFSVLKGTA